MSTKPAPVKWAQRADLVYLNFEVQDVDKPEVVVDKDKVIYRAVTNDNQKYETILNLFGEIKPEESKWINRDRGAEFVLIKQQPGYWKRLLKEDTKYHWLRVDFNRWKDEDDEDDEAGGGGGGGNFEEMMRQMGGLGGMGGMPGMGGLGGMEGLGGMGGMPGMGMDGNDFGNFDDLGPDEKDSDDENIPDLEDGGDDQKKAEEESATTAK